MSGRTMEDDWLKEIKHLLKVKVKSVFYRNGRQRFRQSKFRHKLTGNTYTYYQANMIRLDCSPYIKNRKLYDRIFALSYMYVKPDTLPMVIDSLNAWETVYVSYNSFDSWTEAQHLRWLRFNTFKIRNRSLILKLRYRFF